jgi:hypothetical protein
VHVVSAKQDVTFTTGSGPWSWSSADDMGYNTGDTIRITVTASGRATVTAQGSATTGPPPVAVKISKGRACGGGGGAACTGGTCLNRSCAYIHIQTTNWTTNYTCTFDTSYTGGSPNSGFSTYKSNHDVNVDSSNWLGAPGFTASVVCTGANGTASDVMTWY